MLSDTYLREQRRDTWKRGEPMWCSNDVGEGVSLLEYRPCAQRNPPMPGLEDCTANKVKPIPPILPLSVQESRIRSGLIVTNFVSAILTIYR